MRSVLLFVCAVSCATVVGGQALAQVAQTSEPSSVGAQPSPAAAGLDNGISPICTDRPTKANAACIVGAGQFQYEADVANASFLYLDGVTIDSTMIFNPTLKYGLSSNVDVEANISALDIVHTHDPATGADQTLAGPGDLYLRMKYEFLNMSGGMLQATVLPYVKLPTARLGLGNGAVEEGLIVPVNYKIGSVLTLTIDPEVDALKNSIGEGRHINTAQLVNLAFSLPRGFTLYGELWGDWDFDPSGLVRRFSADAALARAISPRLQLDIGVNMGLNRYTPGAQVYVGISQKF